jgi:hypothetical protein
MPLKLNDASLLETRAYIIGRWVENGRKFAVNKAPIAW